MKPEIPIEIVHLCQRPPYLPGSVNLQLASVLRRLPQFNHATIAERQGDPPADALADPRLLLVRLSDISWKQKLMLRMPCSLRKRWFHEIGGRGSLAYAWRAIAELKRIRPKVVVAYDTPWIGEIIRDAIDWPCRLILSQHGLSYYMESRRAAEIYSLTSFDEIHALTLASYRVDRERMARYESTVTVIPNCIDVDRFRPVTTTEKASLRAKWNLPADVPVVLTLNVLRPKKGIHAVVEGWQEVLRRFPKAVLWVVGGPDPDQPRYERELHDMAKRLGIASNVRFQGKVASQTSHECFQAADLYVFPTLFVEGFALSLAEALATGLPCIASDHLVAREAYDDSMVRFVPDPNLAGAFVEPIVDMLASTEQSAQFGRRAAEVIRAKYSPKATDALWIKFFERQLRLAGKARPRGMAEPLLADESSLEMTQVHSVASMPDLAANGKG